VAGVRGAAAVGRRLHAVEGEPAPGATPGGGDEVSTPEEQGAEERVFADATVAGGTGEVMIELEGVVKRFGDFEALRGIDLKVGRREVVVVIGPSGSGKSTLIRCINRLEKHDAGRIVVDGVELSDDIRRIQEVRR